MTNSVESNPYEITKHKPRKTFQSILLIGNQIKIFYLCMHIHFHSDVKKIWNGGRYLISTKQIHVKFDYVKLFSLWAFQKRNKNASKMFYEMIHLNVMN